MTGEYTWEACPVLKRKEEDLMVREKENRFGGGTVRRGRKDGKM